MAKWVKNTSGATKTWVGTEITNTSYYMLDSTEEHRWANDSTVLADIGAGDLTVAIDNSGSNDITDTAAAINYLKDISAPPVDTDGAPLTRTKITKSGWHFQLHYVEFYTGKNNSVYNKDIDENDLGFATLKFFDSSNNELTFQQTGYESETAAQFQTRLDSNCVKTEMFWEVDHDIEIIGGFTEQTSQPTNDLRLWIEAIPDLTVAQGGSVPFIQGGLNLKHMNSIVDLDGKTPKEMPYNATYHTNKFRIKTVHTAGENHPITIAYKIFRLNA